MAQNILKKAVNLSERGGHAMESLAWGKELEVGLVDIGFSFLGEK